MQLYPKESTRRHLWQSLGGSSLAQKILRQGYFWPTIKKDAFEFSRACDKYQRYANYYNSPMAPLKSLMSPWPLAMWGIDLIGELPKAKGSQFNSKEMREFCEQLGIQKSFSVVCHLQSNGQTEAVNKIIKHTLKTKLEEKKGTWPKELTQVLWSYNMTPRTTTGETPFSLVYGCEAMVPVEVGVGSFRRDNYDSEENEVNHRLYLDMIEETREDVQIR
ncbi:uncharacterized protein LOC141685606 [Apium graveolens]|uniref:uncharacterized protein LOC141685606 n=1 Tax=Apium graveolens TaxID=4045 RepID=UPI003D7B9ECD